MAEDVFTNNPFRSLNAKNFPEKVLGEKRAFHTRKKAERRLSAEEAKEKNLFLRAMQGVEREKEHGKSIKGKRKKEVQLKKREGEQDFLFSSQCDLGALFPVKDKKKHEKIQPLPQEETKEESMEALLNDSSSTDDFTKAMQGVVPLQERGRDVAAPRTTKEKKLAIAVNALQEFLDGKLEFALSFTDEYLEGHVVGLDELIMNKLRHGAFSPETSIDLHGLNVPQAFESLRGFFKNAWYRGLRCVIVISGRGKNSPDGIGILREKLKSWLTQDPFKRIVLAFCTARSCDGGPGSIYVLLRKFKKKGRVYWDRMPADEDLL